MFNALLIISSLVETVVLCVKRERIFYFNTTQAKKKRVSLLIGIRILLLLSTGCRPLFKIGIWNITVGIPSISNKIVFGALSTCCSLRHLLIKRGMDS